MTVLHLRRAFASVVLLSLIAAGCSSDDDETTATDDTTQQADGDDATGDDAAGDDATGDDAAGEVNPEYAEYCAQAAELDQQDSFPTVEQLEDLRDVAPEPIEEEIKFVVDAFIEAIEGGNFTDAFSDPEVEERFGVIEEFEVQECGREAEDENEKLGEFTTELDPAATRVDVSAVEYDFEFETPSAGLTSFVMSNDGDEAHFMLVSKLAEGETFEDVFARAQEGEDVEDAIEVEYESETAAPGDEEVLTFDLEAGNYAMLCFIPNAEGVPHAFLGMAVPFTVS